MIKILIILMNKYNNKLMIKIKKLINRLINLIMIKENKLIN